jgi:CheY-like chemotaxis protein
LLSNAVKFTANGGRVEIRLQKATAPALIQTHSAEAAQITITDSGKGIHPDFLPHVFESFRQEDGKTTRSFGGLGLGLAIVRHLSELHGGIVQAASAGEGQGSTFTVLLPLLHAGTHPDAASIEPPSSSLPLSGLHILVVDDEADARALLLTLLEQAGALVQVASSAVTALAQLKACRPDLLISDIGMPEIDGYMLIRQIRQQPDTATLPALALTAYARTEDRLSVLEAGFQAHLTKPVNSSELIEAILAFCPVI